MNNKSGWSLLVSIMLGCSGCAGMSSDPEVPPESRYKVSARVVDIAPKQPGALSVDASRPRSNEPEQKPPAPPSAIVAQKDPTPAKATTPIRPESSSAEENVEPAERPDLQRPTEPAQNPEEQFLLRVAAERPVVPLDGSVNGEAAVVNYVSGDTQCSRLAITYPERRVSELWRVCADRQFVLERKAEPTPTVPDDPGLEATRRIAVHSAYNDGHASVDYGPFTVSAQSGGPPDARGCMFIRSALSWQGIAMATNDETICSPPEE